MSGRATVADGGIVTGRVLADQGVGPQSASADWIGQKAANLAWLAGRGYRVPPFFVLSSKMCARLLAPAEAEVESVLAGLDVADPASLRAGSAAIRARITAEPFPGDIRAELAERAAELGSGARFAVRTSVSGEDSAANSFAGQLDTALNVGQEGIEEAVLAMFGLRVFRARPLLPPAQGPTRRRGRRCRNRAGAGRQRGLRGRLQL